MATGEWARGLRKAPLRLGQMPPGARSDASSPPWRQAAEGDLVSPGQPNSDLPARHDELIVP